MSTSGFLSQVMQLAQQIAGGVPPVDPEKTMVFFDSSFGLDVARALCRIRYAGVDPIAVNSIQDIKDKANGRDDLHCLVLFFHGAPGEINIGNAQIEILNLGDLLAPEVKVQKHVVMESCVIARKPSSMNVLAHKLGCDIVDGYDFFSATGIGAYLSFSEPRPRNEAEKQALKEKVDEMVENEIGKITMPEQIEESELIIKRSYVMGDEPEINRIKASIFNQLMHKGHARETIYMEAFGKFYFNQKNKRINNYREVRSNAVVINSLQEAEQFESTWVGLDTPLDGKFIRVKKWPLPTP